MELSINGSDEDEFPETTTASEVEPGELVTSGEDNESLPRVRKRVASKVVVPVSNRKQKDNDDQHEGKFNHLKNDPAFKSFLDQMVDDRMAAREALESRKKEKSSKTSKDSNVVKHTFKSPSDTTIYSPGLKKANVDDNILDKISNFVENIRLDNRRNSTIPVSLPASDSRRVEHVDRHGNLVTPRMDRLTADEVASRHGVSTASNTPLPSPNPERVTEQLLVQAEKFKAQIEAPKGNINRNFSDLLMPYDYEKLKSKFVRPDGLAPIDSEIMFLRNFDQDDEFFHVTSQIEPALCTKIERGEFIELERLLPKDRSGGRFAHEELNKQLFQLISQGTNSYVDPPMPKGGKINNVRKWDQAFRVFAAIYTQANPERSSEIWQYIYVIHTAAASNPWDSVYYYDINFRELMASKPWRSWGKTYTQGWNMAFNNSNAFGSYQQTQAGFGSRGQANVGHKTSGKDWKEDCCWRYNKNRCKRTAADCHYEHRCTYCAGWNHGFFNCRKRLNMQKSDSSLQRKNNNSPMVDKTKN